MSEADIIAKTRRVIALKTLGGSGKGLIMCNFKALSKMVLLNSDPVTGCKRFSTEEERTIFPGEEFNISDGPELAVRKNGEPKGVTGYLDLKDIDSIEAICVRPR
jgi:hypothetical protein